MINSSQHIIGPSQIDISNPQVSILSKTLFEDTKDIQAKVERHPFMAELLNNKLNPASYHQYLVDLKEIYATLDQEVGLNLESCREIKEINFPKLNRLSAIEQDLSSDSFKEFSSQPSRSALDYAEYIRQLGRSEPIQLIAHVYVRDLGDLSRGVTLKEHVEKSWSDAIQLYNFDELLEKTQKSTIFDLKVSYLKKLDSLKISGKVQDGLIAHAWYSFASMEKILNEIPLRGKFLKANL